MEYLVPSGNFVSLPVWNYRCAKFVLEKYLGSGITLGGWIEQLIPPPRYRRAIIGEKRIPPF